ncbi:MAG: archaellin/type IV pilin N-terminal domain-containing protein [Candidatus Pacearchaeota archaeon]
MKNKKAISEIVAYVLIITIVLSLSVLVYTWMKRQIPTKTEECPETLSLIIKDYSCDSSNKILNLTLKNMGLYDISGAIIKASNSTQLPIMSINLKNSFPQGKIRNISSFEYYFQNNLNASDNEEVLAIFDYSNLNLITKINVIPTHTIKNDKLLCSNQKIEQEIKNCI